MFGTFDIESRDWKHLLALGSYDGKTYKEFFSMEDYIKYLFSPDNTCTTYYAHFGGIFDFLFLIDFLFTKTASDLEIESRNLIINGRKILKLEFYRQRPKKKITFIDSSGLFPFSLKNLTESFDVKHKKLDANVELFTKVTKKMLKYMKYDVIGLYECIEKFSQAPYINKVGIKLTRSGTSFAVYKKFFDESHLHIISDQVCDFARLAYFGGRTEIFKPLYINKKKPLNVYDINSLYPSVMHDYEYPSTVKSWVTEYEAEGFGIYHCLVKCPTDLKIPVLPTKADGKLIFPVGTFNGYWTNIELNKAIELGYEILEVHNGVTFENGGHIFKPFISHFYKERKKTKCPVQNIIFKDIMNHLYGRLAINKVREKFSFERPEGGKLHSSIDRGEHEIRFYSVEKEIFTYSNPVLSTFVTAYARLRLYEYFERLKFDIYYCDTDSVFTPRKLRSSKELGAMKLEYQLKEACFLLPKTYGGTVLTVDDSHEFIRKMKGFQKKNISHITFEDYKNALEGDYSAMKAKQSGGLAGIKTAMKKGEILTVLPDSNKQLRHKYDKRIIQKLDNDYLTIPLELSIGESDNVFNN